MTEKPTHRCNYCGRHIIPDERYDNFGPTGELRCPRCGAEGDSDEFGVREPWVQELRSD